MSTHKSICRKIFSRSVNGRKTLFNETFLVLDTCFCEHSCYFNDELKLLWSQFFVNYNKQNRTFEDMRTSLQGILNYFDEMNDEDNKNVYQKICDLGVLEMLLDILVSDVFRAMPLFGNEQPMQLMMTCPKENIDGAFLVLRIIDFLVHRSFTSLHPFRWNDKVIEALFSLLLESPNVSNLASLVLEEIVLGIDQPPFCFADIHGFHNLLENLDITLKTSPLFHLLSVFMSDSEYVATSNSILQRHDHWLPTRSAQTVESNQRFLLDIPNFLERLSLAACQAPFYTSSASTDSNEMTDFILLLSHLISYDMQLLQFDDNNPAFREPFLSIKKQSIMLFVADIFHMISFLLLGSHRNEVQQRLAECGFFTSLPQPFEQILGGQRTQPSIEDFNFPSDPSQPAEEVSINTYVQVQCLRLVHAIADSHANRYYLLSSQEIEKLKQRAENTCHSLPQDLLQFDITKAYTGDCGLLSFIIDKLKVEDANSLIRFWINRAMEAFLRGKTSAVHQLFLLDKNVIEDTVKVLLSCGTKHEMVVQGAFDFLSTAMRNNAEAFSRFERAIDCTANFTQLVKEMNENLVDSNMFIRCIILTNYQMRGASSEHINILTKSRLINWFVDSTAQIEVACKLIRLLSLPNLTQENISCLNTTILVLYLADKEYQLPRYLSALYAQPDGEFLLTNLKTLLQFWRTHYHLPSKNSDRLSLQLSTNVDFEDWCQFVNLLLGTDSTSPRTLRYYTSKKKTTTPQLPRPSRLS